MDRYHDSGDRCGVDDSSAVAAFLGRHPLDGREDATGRAHAHHLQAHLPPELEVNKTQSR